MIAARFSIKFHDDRTGQKRIIEVGVISGLLSRNQKESSRKRLVKFGRERRDIANQRGKFFRRRVAGQGNYIASKAGLIGMIKSVAAEYARRGVTANAIAPGFVASAMTDKLNEKQREAILARVPAARLGSGADIAAAAVYLASEEAGYVNGQTIHVNGGMAMI